MDWRKLLGLDKKGDQTVSDRERQLDAELQKEMRRRLRVLQAEVEVIRRGRE